MDDPRRKRQDLSARAAAASSPRTRVHLNMGHRCLACRDAQASAVRAVGWRMTGSATMLRNVQVRGFRRCPTARHHRGNLGVDRLADQPVSGLFSGWHQPVPGLSIPARVAMVTGKVSAETRRTRACARTSPSRGDHGLGADPEAGHHLIKPQHIRQGSGSCGAVSLRTLVAYLRSANRAPCRDRPSPNGVSAAVTSSGTVAVSGRWLPPSQRPARTRVHPGSGRTQPVNPEAASSAADAA